MRVFLILSSIAVLISGCAEITDRIPDFGRAEVPPSVVTTETASVGARIPPKNARTVEQFDTTSAVERQAAIRTSGGSGGYLGMTIASLGAPTVPGFWLKTPLVDAEIVGRIRLTSGGDTIEVMLQPRESAGSGSQISLPAMRLLGVPLTALPELNVYGPSAYSTVTDFARFRG